MATTRRVRDLIGNDEERERARLLGPTGQGAGMDMDPAERGGAGMERILSDEAGAESAGSGQQQVTGRAAQLPQAAQSVYQQKIAKMAGTYGPTIDPTATTGTEAGAEGEGEAKLDILGKDYPLSQQRVLTGLYESMQGQPERLESELTQLAYDKMMGYDGTRPGDYESRYRPQIDELLAQIAGREGFSYDPAEDPLYRSMRDQYLRLGNRAMQDTMAQAAGLTGGYGNSYAAGAGQQAYQDYLSGLNGQLPNLYQLAYQQYRDELGDKYDQLSALSGLDATDYSRFRDLVGDWETDRDWWTQRYDRESGMDMTRYEQDLAAWQADRDWWYKLLDKMQDPLEMARAGASGGGSGGGGGRTAKVDPMLRSGGKEFESVKTKGTPSSAGLPSTGMVGTGGMTEAELRAALLAQGYNLDEVDAYVAGQKQTGIPLFDVSGVPDKQGQIVVPAGGGTTGGTTGKVTLPIDASTGGGAEVFGMYGTGLDPAQLEELARQYGISPNK